MSSEQDRILTTRESKVSTVIIGLLLVVAGFLIYSYFSSPEDSSGTSLTQSNGEIETVIKEEEPTPENEQQDVTYTVQPGDTLWEIAEDKLGDGSEWRELAKVNNIPQDNPTLDIGQELIVSGFGGPADEGDVLSAVTAEKEESGEVKVTEKYTVQKGDTLWDVAEKFYGDGEKWTKIFNSPENNLSMYTSETTGETYPLIHQGNVLVIPRE